MTNDSIRVENVHQLFARHATTRPERTAITYGTEDITYGQLNARASHLAQRLRAVGVHGNAPVGILLERSPECVAAMLAVLNVGACYVPLDPSYPTPRLHAMLATGGVRTVVSHMSLAHRLPETVATIDALCDPLPQTPVTTPAAQVHPDGLAYIMFTSGSTGTPKAVAVPHSGILRLIDDPNYVRLNAGAVLAHLSSPSFDAATFEIWGALANGARLVIAPGGPVSTQSIVAILQNSGVTCAWLTAGLFNVMVDEHLDGLSTLNQLLTGGDTMSPAQAGKFLAAFPDCRLINGYGPTEATTFTACHTVTPADTLNQRIPIGRPIDGTSVEILDDEYQPVPVGTIGQLYVGGLGVARGYVGDPALTAERFIPDPSASGRRRYATGDLAVCREDGNLDLLGRIDQQIKKRGFRIEPAEIEETLRRDPEVKNAAVVLHGSQADEKTLIAYLVVGSQTTDTHDIGMRVRDHLPNYLIPDRFEIVEKLPLTSNGKVDRNLLTISAEKPPPRPDTSKGEPLSETEKILAGIWSEVLNRPMAGRHENFFSHGGQSLQASRMEARIRSRIGVSISLRSIFDHPTITELAHHIDQKRQNG
ncbi:non-ribosomal peptide synthetase [Streptomyces virginiae]|uniref:non-ribosomal peptide synthetase n=1 Tax=Streptomyces virginiae TaxID=1961 RepID=UPI0007C65AD5|nr:non-ribosomal peptide synthetase [Streptomyces virginiae]